MTLIDYFVAAYWENKGVGVRGAGKIVNQCGKKYLQAREEYDCMKQYYSTGELLDWIEPKLHYMKIDFMRTYRGMSV